MFRLQGNSGIYHGKSIPLEEGSTVILGRDAAIAQLVLNDQMISGKHARLEIGKQGVILVDSGSTNGTFLSTGERLTPEQPYPLRPGDSFYLADNGNSFVLIEENESPAEHEKETVRTKNTSIGFSIASLVFGIIAAILCIAYVTVGLNFIFAAVAGVLGLVFGVISIVGKAKGKPIAVIGSILGAISLLVILGLVIFKIVHPEEPQISGVYTCEEYDRVRDSMKKEIEDAAEDANIAGKVTEKLLENLFFDGQATFTFLEDGRVLIAPFNKAAIEFGTLSWTDAGDNNLFITLDLSDVRIAGCSIPIKISYRTEYEITKDTLKLDLFGQEVTLTRINSEK